MSRWVAAALLVALPLTPELQRGKAIYDTGSGARPITATLSPSMDVMPAALVPCLNCHGEDGRGRAEGGVRPADISPEALRRPANVNGRTRAAYTNAQLKRAITMGIDSSRNQLNDAMPRYQLTMREADDLLAYLPLIGHEPQPGITDDVVRIRVIGATLTPPQSRVYGRRIEFVQEGDAFVTLDARDDPSSSIEAADREQMPTIVLHAHAPLTSRYVFALTASDDDARAALHTFAATLPPSGTPPLLLTSEEARLRDLATLPRDVPVIVAAPFPPTGDARRAAIAAGATIVANLLAQLGRDVTRSKFRDALEHVYAAPGDVLPPLTWNANRHHATTAAWVMTLDRATQRLVAQPGWIE